MTNFLQQAPCLFFILADDGTILEVNETLCSRLGYTREELVGKKAEIIFTIATRIFQQTHFYPLLKMQGHAEEIFITLQSKNKDQVPVLINAQQTTSDNRQVYIYVGIIVNNRKKFEDELIAAKKAAEKALNENTALVQAKQELQQHVEQLDRQIAIVNKQNEELRQFNRVVTHDLQEPLRKLSIFGNMLMETNNDKSPKRIVEKMLKVREQMLAIVSGLQQYIWLTETPVELAEIDLQLLITEVCRELRKEYSQTQLNVEIEDHIRFQADWQQMKLLFYQLLSNAIRFSKSKTEAFVSIEAKHLMLNRFQNMKHKYQYVEFLRIQVTDAGIGFDTEFKNKVFELFKKLHPESGRGIGLSLCKKVVDNHGGDILIDTKPEAGTTVTILLPKDQHQKSKHQTSIKNESL